MPEVKKIQISENLSGQRLDNFLFTELKGVPKSKIYSIIRKGEIRVNSKRKRPSYKLNKGDEIRIPPIRTTNKENHFVPSKIISLLKESIIYENEDYIALNKPSGIASHGGSRISIGVIEAIRNFGKEYRDVKLIHRLDKDTSGCQIIAKNNKFLRLCNTLISERKVKKTYQAVVEGKWTNREGLYEIHLKKNFLKGNERVVKIDEGGKIAQTILKVIKKTDKFSLMQCELITGRTHQLRVQLSSLGHPIIGDVKYGKKNSNKAKFFQAKNRMYLHADSFVSKELDIKIFANAPEEFKKILKNDE
jgi:23S rRNA pseudouridine955/2504/2580 synthase